MHLLDSTSTLPTVLVVDDNTGILALVNQVLQGHYKTILLTSGEQALKYLQKNVPDLIVLDIEMPGMNGYEVLHEIKSDSRTASVPVIFFTALNDNESELEGLTHGAIDFIGKPVIPRLLRHRIRIQLDLYRYQHRLEEMVDMKTMQLIRLQRTTIDTLTELSEFRDTNTGSHIKRTSLYVETLVCGYAANLRHSDRLNIEMIDNIVAAAPLHDVGKMAIPDAILLKPGALTREEFDVMKTHVEIGARALRKATEELGFASFLDMGLELCLTHHEKWDGTGYPQGLAEDAIPLSGRIMAVADVYDALTSARPYKEPFSHEKAVAIIREGKGTHFDPDLIDVFCETSGHFAEINDRFSGENTITALS